MDANRDDREKIKKDLSENLIAVDSKQNHQKLV